MSKTDELKALVKKDFARRMDAQIEHFDLLLKQVEQLTKELQKEGFPSGTGSDGYGPGNAVLELSDCLSMLNDARYHLCCYFEEQLQEKNNGDAT